MIEEDERYEAIRGAASDHFLFGSSIGAAACLLMRDLREAFIQGALWADKHPRE